MLQNEDDAYLQIQYGPAEIMRPKNEKDEQRVTRVEILDLRSID